MILVIIIITVLFYLCAPSPIFSFILCVLRTFLIVSETLVDRCKTVPCV